MEIRVLSGEDRIIIDTKNFDSSKHKHVSGRDFTVIECANFKPEKVVKTIEKKVISKK